MRCGFDSRWTKSKDNLRLLKERKFAMIYSAEVQHMCTVAKQVPTMVLPHPRGGGFRPSRSPISAASPRHRLVRSSAGLLQADPEMLRKGIIEEALVETLAAPA